MATCMGRIAAAPSLSPPPPRLWRPPSHVFILQPFTGCPACRRVRPFLPPIRAPLFPLTHTPLPFSGPSQCSPSAASSHPAVLDFPPGSFFFNRGPTTPAALPPPPLTPLRDGVYRVWYGGPPVGGSPQPRRVVEERPGRRPHPHPPPAAGASAGHGCRRRRRGSPAAAAPVRGAGVGGRRRRRRRRRGCRRRPPPPPRAPHAARSRPHGTTTGRPCRRRLLRPHNAH